MSSEVSWREAISSEELKTLLKRFEVRIPNDPSRESFVDKILTADLLHAIVQDVKSLAEGVEIKRNSGIFSKVKPGTIHAFEIDIGKSGDEWPKELIESRFLDHANKDLIRVLLIKGESIGVIDAKLIVYEKCKQAVDTRDIFLQHIYDDDFDEIAKLSAYKKISSRRDFTKQMIDTFSTDNLRRVINLSMDSVLTRTHIRHICFQVTVRYDDEYVGSVEDGACNCRYSGNVKRIKAILSEETLYRTARQLGSEICKEISMHIESVVQSTLAEELGKLKLNISDFIFAEIEETIKAKMIQIFHTIYGVIVSVTTFIITIFRPVDVNSKAWRSQVADEVFDNISEKKYSLRLTVLEAITKLTQKTREGFIYITNELEEFQRRVIPKDKTKLIKEWQQRDIIEDKWKSSLLNHRSIIKFIVGHKGDKKPVVKVFTRDDEEMTKSFFISCCKNSEHAMFEFENVKDPNRIYDDNEKMTFALDKEKRKALKEFIKSNAKKIYATYSNIVGMQIGCVSGFGDTETESHGIILYCLDKTIIPFGENPLPDQLSKWPCSCREDLFMFGKCPKDCLSTNHKLLEPGCSIGKPLCAWSGSVGFRYESMNPNNELGSGFLTAAHVAVEDFQKLYRDKTLLSSHSLGSKQHSIVHPICKDHRHVDNNVEHDQVVGEVVKKVVEEVVGEVVESFFGNFGESETGLDIAIVRGIAYKNEGKEPLPVVKEDDLNLRENINVMKKGSTTKTTYGDLLDSSLSAKIDLDSLSTLFVSFEDLYLVGNKSKDEPFCKDGDSGSGVYLIGNKTYTPLGLVIGSSKNFQRTLVCKIDKFLDRFGLEIV